MQKLRGDLEMRASAECSGQHIRQVSKLLQFQAVPSSDYEATAVLPTKLLGQTIHLQT